MGEGRCCDAVWFGRLERMMEHVSLKCCPMISAACSSEIRAPILNNFSRGQTMSLIAKKLRTVSSEIIKPKRTSVDKK